MYIVIGSTQQLGRLVQQELGSNVLCLRLLIDLIDLEAPGTEVLARRGADPGNSQHAEALARAGQALMIPSFQGSFRTY